MLRKISNLSLLLFFIPGIAAAAEKITENKKDASLIDFLTRIKNYLLGFVGALAVLFIVWAGIQYITSAGSKDRIEKAKKTLTYAVVGLIAVILSGLVLSLISGNFLPSVIGDEKNVETDF